jgi:hypothetical protein
MYQTPCINRYRLMRYRQQLIVTTSATIRHKPKTSRGTVDWWKYACFNRSRASSSKKKCVSSVLDRSNGADALTALLGHPPTPPGLPRTQSGAPCQTECVVINLHEKHTVLFQCAKVAYFLTVGKRSSSTSGDTKLFNWSSTITTSP